MPRTELNKRAVYKKNVADWLADGTVSDNVYKMGNEQCRWLSDMARFISTEVCATYDGKPITLGPYEQAMVPAVWGTGWKGSQMPEMFMAVNPGPMSEEPRLGFPS